MCRVMLPAFLRQARVGQYRDARKLIDEMRSDQESNPNSNSREILLFRAMIDWRLGNTVAEMILATGTTDVTPGKAQHMRSAQDAKPCVDRASGCDDDVGAVGTEVGDGEVPNVLQMDTLRGGVRRDASCCDSGRSGDRTRTSLTGHGILSPVRLPIPPFGLGPEVYPPNATPTILPANRHAACSLPAQRRPPIRCSVGNKKMKNMPPSPR